MRSGGLGWLSCLLDMVLTLDIPDLHYYYRLAEGRARGRRELPAFEEHGTFSCERHNYACHCSWG